MKSTKSDIVLHFVWATVERAPPEWLQKLQPEGLGSVADVVCKWPGNETDDEIAQALARLSYMDALCLLDTSILVHRNFFSA